MQALTKSGGHCFWAGTEVRTKRSLGDGIQAAAKRLFGRVLAHNQENRVHENQILGARVIDTYLVVPEKPSQPNFGWKGVMRS